MREIALENEPVTIGRKPTNNVQIDNPAVSGEHARVVMIYNDWILEDLGSTNGTLVNGARVKKHILRTNDQIEFGNYTLKFIGESRAPQPAAAAEKDESMEKTILVRGGGGASRPAARPVTAAAAPASMLEKLSSWFKSWLK